MLNHKLANTQTLLLAELYHHDAFCTPLEARYDRLTRLARASLSMPVAAITVAAGERLWFKSVEGWEVRELRLAESLSERALASRDLVIIEDTRLDFTTARQPLVVRPPGFRFYAGQSLLNQRGEPVGTFEVYDIRPRTLSASELQIFRDLVYLAKKELLTADLHDAQKQLMEKLDLARREAHIDPLTSTWNRRAADELLENATANADDSGSAVAVAAIDIDNFKGINDTWGHAAGDGALRRVARTLVSGVRDGDAVCRIGGDEFLIIMERVGATDADEIVDRLQKSVAETPVRLREGMFDVTITTGTSVRRPGEKLSAADLVQRADRALYKAKKSR